MISPIENYLRMLLRPWKVISFVLGMASFIMGALFFALPTWDVGVSIWMSALCYTLAPLGVSLALTGLREKRRWQRVGHLIGAAGLVYFVGSGSYQIYHLVVWDQHPPTYWENVFYSIPVTIIAGILWRFDGTLMDLIQEIRDAMAR